MRVRFKNRTGNDRWADIEDVTMLIKLDGTAVTSLAAHHGASPAWGSSTFLGTTEFQHQVQQIQRHCRNYSLGG